MNEYKIEREAVLWAWRILHEGEPSPRDIAVFIKAVLSGDVARPCCAMAPAESARLVRIAIAYVEAAKNHIDTVLELETNLDRVTKELESLRTVATWYRIADHQRDFASNATTESYRKAAEAMDKALIGGPGGT